MIAEETIHEIRERASLIEVAGEIVKFRQRGRNYVALCPFHQEKTPSFFVRDTGESFYCFGCGAGGNVISFVMKAKGCTFPEAVEELAQRYGIKVKYVGAKKKDTGISRDLIYRINREAQAFFLKALAHAPEPVWRYIKERHFSDAAISKFGIGYAEDSWNSLLDYLRKKGFDDSELLQAGIAQRANSGRIYSRFRGRLIFPIFLDSARIAGFGARKIPAIGDDDADAPKYVNSPETLVYRKSKIIYGLPLAYHEIRNKGSVYLVEGYTDVISMWDSGIKNTVAVCGTAVTRDHIKRLASLCPTVFVVFDGDTAGRHAAARMFPLSLNAGAEVKAVFLPEGEDPDSFVKKHKENAVDALKSCHTTSLLDAFIDGLVEKVKTGGKIEELGSSLKGKIAGEVASLLRQVKNSVEQADLIQLAAERLRVDAEDLKKLVERGAQGAFPKRSKNDHEKKGSFTQLPTIDRELLKAVISDPELVCEALKNALVCGSLHSKTIFFLDSLNEIYEKDCPDEEKKACVRDFLDASGPQWRDLWKESHKIKRSVGQKGMKKMYLECVNGFKKVLIKQRVREVDLELKYCEDEREKLKLGQERLGLIRALNHS